MRNLKQAALALVAETVTGFKSTRTLDPDLLRMIEIADLPIALRTLMLRTFGANGIVSPLASPASP